jgi:exonuclease SbcC
MSGKNLTASGIATLNGKIAANGAELVSKFIQKKLGMDWKSFYTSIFAKQKELNTLSSMNPSERRQLILRMLGINAVDDIISKIRGDIKEKKTVVEKLEFDLLDPQGKQKITVYYEELQFLEKKQKDLVKQIEELKKKRFTIEADLQKIKKDYDTKKQTYEKIYATKDQYEEKKTKFEKKLSLKEDIKTQEKSLHERQTYLEKQNEKLTLFRNLEKDLQTLEVQQQKNYDSTQIMIKKQEQNRTMMHRLREDIRELMIKKQHIEKMGPQAKCPTCERILGDQQHKLIELYSEELAKKNSDNQKLSDDEKKFMNEYERLSREKQALQKKNIFLRSQVVDRERLQTTVHNISEEIQREKRKLEVKKKELRSVGAIEFDEKQYHLIRTGVNEAYRNYQTSLLKLDDIKEKHQAITLKQKEQEGSRNLINQQIKTIEKSIDEQQKCIKKLGDERCDVQRLSILSEVMDSYRIYLISQIRPTLSSHASELFDELTDGKYSQIELDEDYNILIYDQGQPYRIERFSGGEEDLANLCIRLAISEIITERAGSIFNFIILDEIFGSQDQIRKQNIIKALNSFSSKFRQIFLITHVDDIKHFTENTLIISEDDTGISTIKVE